MAQDVGGIVCTAPEIITYNIFRKIWYDVDLDFKVLSLFAALRTKGRVYQVHSSLLYGCETWPVRSIDEIACYPWNCGAVSTLQVCRHCSCKEGSAGFFMLQGVPKVN